MRRPAQVVFGLLLAGCSSSQLTAIDVTVHSEPSWALTALEVEAGSKDATLDVDQHVRLLLPDEMAGSATSLEIWGKRADVRWAHGATMVTPVLHREISVDVTLTRLPCGAWCTAGSVECAGGGVATCEQRDDDECLEWSNTIACPADAPYCSLGVCGKTCTDECAMGETRCDGPGGVRACGQNDNDTCLDWLPVAACGPGETCSNGTCGTTCQDECTAGAIKCAGNGTATCADLNGDGCLEWGPVVTCAGGTTCSAGHCSATCTDDCSTDMCDANSLKVCGNYDLDACKEYSPGTSCVPSDPCMEGMCSDNACETAPKVCEQPPASSCVNDHTLRVYDAAGTCGGGTCTYASHDVACNNCPSCDPCAGVTCNTPPAPTCADSNTLRTYAASGSCTSGSCSYMSSDTTCASGCSGGACACSGSGCAHVASTIAAGDGFSCGLKTDGSIACWGDNSSGQATPPAGTFSAVTAGFAFACGIKTDGSLACWGSNDDAQSTPPSGTFSTVSAGDQYACGLKTDGTIACWGGVLTNVLFPMQAPSGTFVAVDAGSFNACSIKPDTSVICWGSGSFLGSPLAGSFSSVSAGTVHACGVKTDDSVACWGGNDSGQATPPAGSFTAVSAASAYTCGLKAGGTVVCWGDDADGNTSPPAGSFSSLSTGVDHACGIKTDGTVACWGNNDHGQATPPSGTFLQ